MINKWDKRFLKITQSVADWSKDESTKVGCVFVNDKNRILVTGYNGIPEQLDDNNKKYHERPDKYYYFEHAERNAVYNATDEGIKLSNSKVYLNWFPCASCTRALLRVGIRELNCDLTENLINNARFWSEFQASYHMLKEAKIVIKIFIDDKMHFLDDELFQKLSSS